MDLLQVIKLVSIPRWVKFCALCIIIGFISFALYAIFGGKYLADGAIVQAGTSLLGVLLPLAIVIILLSFYESGVKPLRKTTQDLLTNLLPEIFTEVGVIAGQTEKRTVVNSELIKPHCCLYKLELPSKHYLKLEIQLNVKKVCVALYFLSDNVKTMKEDFWFDLFSHTLAGADCEKYKLNKKLGNALHNGKQYSLLVMYKDLPVDFLWNSAEKLYFCQDLLAMVDSFINEGMSILEQPE